MRVTLAVPYDGHQPGDTISVDERAGRQLIRDGWARLPKADTVGDMNTAELRAFAAKHHIGLGDARRKADIVAAIEAAQTRVTSSTNVLSPAAGAENEET